MQFDELLRNINNELNNADARIFPFNEGKELMQALKENQLAIDSLTVISEWGDKYYLCFNGKYNKHTYKKHLKNLLNELISHISGKLLSPGVVSDKISFIMDTSVSLGFRFIEDSFLLNYFSHPPLPPLIPKDENLNKIVDNLIDKEFSEKFSSVSKEFFDQLIRILESNYNFVSSIAPIKITPDISSFERSITSYNFLHSHLLSTQIDFHISNNNVTFTFNDSSEYTDYKSLMNKTFKAFKNEIHVTISSNNYSSDEIYWFFKSLI
ncbi:MAG: hypothetical protein HOK35_00990, partial [Cytophagia bacterium]|nr:hypothetical protein [Cytophagia bacterium]MBT7996785.1 hypothetical protein [Bacteroidota bacterium]